MRRRADRGAVTIEAAFILPILVLILFGIIDIGTALKSYSATAGAVRAGARVATVQGSDPMIDSTILARLSQEMSTDDARIDVIVIWHPTTRNEHVPVACLPSSTTAPNTSSMGVTDGGTDALGACNVYVLPAASGGAFAKANGLATFPASYYFGCQGLSDPAAATKLDCNWPGKDRRVLTTPRTAATTRATDYVGVYMRAVHTYYTAALGSTLTITDQTVALIEPQGYDTT